MGNRSKDAGDFDEKERRKRENRKETLIWIENMEATMGKYKTAPPTEIVLCPDLMDRAWGWSRLVVYEESDTTVEWPAFMEYLKEYFNRNVACLFTMNAAATYCLKEERRYRAIHEKDLSAEDMNLSESIQKRAICILNSGAKSDAAAAGLMCMAEEAKLMSDLRGDDLKSMSVFSSYIRQSALHLTHYQGSESSVIAAALLGMSKETISVRNVMSRGNNNISVEEAECGYVREGTCQLLETLENYFASEIAGIVDEHASLPSSDITVGGFNTDKAVKPVRETVVELKSGKSNGNENAKDTNGHGGNKKRKRSQK